jgi:hypothetical protein
MYPVGARARHSQHPPVWHPIRNDLLNMLVMEVDSNPQRRRLSRVAVRVSFFANSFVERTRLFNPCYTNRLLNKGASTPWNCVFLRCSFMTDSRDHDEPTVKPRIHNRSLLVWREIRVRPDRADWEYPRTVFEERGGRSWVKGRDDSEGTRPERRQGQNHPRLAGGLDRSKATCPGGVRCRKAAPKQTASADRCGWIGLF